MKEDVLKCIDFAKQQYFTPAYRAETYFDEIVNWEFKEGANVDTSEFWYDLTDGGYIKPDELLNNKEQIEKLNDAINIVLSFEKEIDKRFYRW